MIDVTRTAQGGTLFFLHTKSAALALLASERGFLLLPYWGARLKTNDLSYVINEIPFVSYMADTEGDKDFQLGVLPQFYPSFGNSYLRSPAFLFTYEDGSRTTDLYYQGYEVYPGKHRPEGLPYVRPDGGAETLEIQLYDRLKEIAVILSLTVYEAYDAVTQSVRVENRSRVETIRIEKLCSASIDLPDADFAFLHLDGAWGREFQIRRQKLEQGLVSIGSVSGASGHGHNPFAALVSPGTDETHGQVYAVNFVYSGNFQICAEVDMHQNTRFQAGLHPLRFFLAAGAGRVLPISRGGAGLFRPGAGGNVPQLSPAVSGLPAAGLFRPEGAPGPAEQLGGPLLPVPRRRSGPPGPAGRRGGHGAVCAG